MPDLAPVPWKKPFWIAVRRAIQDIGEDNLSFVAGGVAFFGFLAVFPAIGALVMIWGIFSDAATIEAQLAPLAAAMPTSAYDVLEQQLASVTSASDQQLGIGAVIALVFSLWSSTKGSRAIIAAMNIAYAQRDRRDFFHANLIALSFTAGGIIYSLLSLALIAALPPVLEAIQIGAWTEFLIHLGRWIFAIALFTGALSVVYQWAPYRSHAPWRWIAPGAVVATLLWILASFAFSIYAGNFANYNATFGALGSAVALMMWMWLSSFIVCFGAVLNAELEPGRRGRRIPSQELVAESKKGPALAEPLYLDETG